MKVLRSVMQQEGSKNGIADKTAGILVVQADASVAVSQVFEEPTVFVLLLSFRSESYLL